MILDYIDSVRHQCLPFWHEVGFDAGRDLFHERMSLGGEPLVVPRRAMVQARQIYVYSQAAMLGWDRGGLEIASRAMHRMRALFADGGAGAGFAFSCDPAGRAISSAERDSYTQAFVLFAAAHLYRATGERSLIPLMDELTGFIEGAMTDPAHGGVVDRLHEGGQAAKRQNPQMHLLEAFLAAEQALPDRGYQERVLRLVDLLRQRLLDRQRGLLREHFAHDWSGHPDPARADIVEPGHHYEWVWLLEQAERLLERPLSEERDLLLATAQRNGHADTGLIYDELEGTDVVATASHRLWPHTEAIKAATTLHRGGDARGRGEASRMGGLLLDHFLGRPFPGGWIDHLHPDLNPRVDYVPASSLYHLFLAAVEADRAFGRSVDNGPGPRAIGLDLEHGGS